MNHFIRTRIPFSDKARTVHCKKMPRLCALLLFFSLGQPADPALKFVQILYRHGARSVEPNWGPGELTKEGKQQMYQMGTELRERYSNYLDPDYSFDLIRSITSDSNRVKNSAQILLTGLFPPSKRNKIDQNLNWQPISSYYIPTESDVLLTPWNACPNYATLVGELLQAETKDDARVFKLVTARAGVQIQTYADFLRFYLGLSGLPDWISQEPARELAQKTLRLMGAKPELRKILVGFLLQELLSVFQMKLQGKFYSRKMQLYGGHDLTIASLLTTLRIFPYIEPSFGAQVIFELHELNQTHYLKIFYKNSHSEPVELVKVPDCQALCPFSTFVLKSRELMPGPETCGKRVLCDPSTGFLVSSPETLTVVTLCFHICCIFLLK